ncbi:MAG: tetratricopeptide repeat protein, partial [Candidatus Sulfotelmatobacter sp.]
MLLATLFFWPTTASAVGAGSGSEWSQTNTGSNSAVQADNDVRELELGKPVERELVGGHHHSYQVALASGQFLHVVVEPHGIGVTARLFGPDSKPLMTLGVMAGSHEPLFLVAKEQGIYRIEIRSAEGAAGSSYGLRVEELRVATSQDSNRALAESALAEGEQLDQEGTAESKRKALEKYEQALPLWRAAGDRRGEAETLYDIGDEYQGLNEKQKALEYYNQALTLAQAKGNRAGEDTALNDIGLVYDSLGENQKALDYYNQALSLRRAVGNRVGEAA